MTFADRPFPNAQRRRLSCRPLTPDDVVYLDDLWLPRVDSQFREDRCEALAKCGHLLWRVPDLADPMLIARSEANLELQSVSRKDAFLVQPTYRVVVLLSRQRRGSEPDKRAHGEPPYWGGSEHTLLRTAHKHALERRLLRLVAAPIGARCGRSPGRVPAPAPRGGHRRSREVRGQRSRSDPSTAGALATSCRAAALA